MTEVKKRVVKVGNDWIRTSAVDAVELVGRSIYVHLRSGNRISVANTADGHTMANVIDKLWPNGRIIE